MLKQVQHDGLKKITLFHRIMPMPTPPWVASPYPFQGHPPTFQRAIFFNCRNAILRTCGRIPTSTGQQGRNSILIYFYQPNKKQ